jgi:hypothetical protein
MTDIARATASTRIRQYRFSSTIREKDLQFSYVCADEAELVPPRVKHASIREGPPPCGPRQFKFE